MKTELVQNYTTNENGKAVLVNEEQVEVQGPSIAELEELKAAQ